MRALKYLRCTLAKAVTRKSSATMTAAPGGEDAVANVDCGAGDSSNTAEEKEEDDDDEEDEVGRAAVCRATAPCTVGAAGNSVVSLVCQ